MEKNKIRELTLEKRRSLTSKYIEEASESIFFQLMEDKAVKDANNILVYSDFDNEVKTAKLTGWLLYQGKNVYLPMIVKKEMFAANIRSVGLELSKFGVVQPKAENAQTADPETLDLIIVPGVAFDRAKNRLGFGFGYYDTFLASAKHAEKIALAYEFQIVEAIPSEAHDIKMDRVITPEMVIV